MKLLRSHNIIKDVPYERLSFRRPGGIYIVRERFCTFHLIDLSFLG